MTIDNIITGERIQRLCDLYLSNHRSDFEFNPRIGAEPEKCILLESICEDYDNPPNVFCYSHALVAFSEKIHFFQNKFVLFSGNSDHGVYESEWMHKIADADTLTKWFAQNLTVSRPKITNLPIGFTNSQWPHGDLDLFFASGVFSLDQTFHNKPNQVYFHFNIGTCESKRRVCYDQLKDKLPWLNGLTPLDNLKRLATYQFCICPEGNGADTHRLWEALYLRVVPVVVDSPYIRILTNHINIPIVILNRWDDFDPTKVDYSIYRHQFGKCAEMYMDYFRNMASISISISISTSTST